MKVKTVFIVFLLLGSPVFADVTPKEVTHAATVEGPSLPDKAGVTHPKGEVDPIASAEEIKVIEDVEKEGLNWWQLLLKHLMELVFSVLGIMSTVLVTVLFRKYGFEAHTTKINDILERAVGFAEQKSMKLAKLEGKPLDSVKKLDEATAFAIKLARDYKLPNKGSDWWEDKLEAWLGVKKAN